MHVALDPTAFTNLTEFYLHALDMIYQPGDLITGHKTTMAHRIVGTLLHQIPYLKVLYIIRDPRDVVTSALVRFKDEDKDEGVFDYIEGWQQGYNTIKRQLYNSSNSKRVMILRYEDLILNTEKTIDDLNYFFGLNSITLPNLMTDYGDIWRNNSSFGDMVELFDKKPIGRWKSRGRELGMEVEAILASELEELGYELTNGITRIKKLEIRSEYEKYWLAKMEIHSNLLINTA